MATEAVLTAVQMASQTSKLLRREEVAEGTMAFHFEKPSGFKFKAGQFVDVTLIIFANARFNYGFGAIL